MGSFMIPRRRHVYHVQLDHTPMFQQLKERANFALEENFRQERAPLSVMYVLLELAPMKPVPLLVRIAMRGSLRPPPVYLFARIVQLGHLLILLGPPHAHFAMLATTIRN